jgi:tetratricopeptide (TPR) repeat protein
LTRNNQLGAAEEAASQAINLFLGKGDQFEVCQCHRILGNICRSKGKIAKATDHLKTALRIASSFDWHNQKYWILRSLADLFFIQGQFDDTYAHIEHAKLYVVNDIYLLGCAMRLQAEFLFKQHRLKEAKSEALQAIGVFEKLGTTKGVEGCRELLQDIEGEMNSPVISEESLDDDGEFLKAMPPSHVH